MNKKNIIMYLLIANLTLIFIYLLDRFSIVHNIFNTFIDVIITPVVFGIFLFYLLKPINNFMIRHNVKKSISSVITILISLIIIFVCMMLLEKYILSQVNDIKMMVSKIISNKEFYFKIRSKFGEKNIYSAYKHVLNLATNYLTTLFSSIRVFINRGMILFSNILLVFLLAFFFLKDGDKLKNKVLDYIPKKYKEFCEELLSSGDNVLSTYIIGQATVALALATMIFIGYLIIDMPSAFLLSSITFILAFIPFIGFFISLIIPYIVAITMGFSMILKLTSLVIIAQTLKGRIVVPFIMGKRMKIHPITDIFLVVCAASIGGTLAAFCIVPIYSLLKMSYGIYLKYKQCLTDNIDKEKKV